MMRVAILTDTNSGISKEEAENIGIYVMPMPILIDGEVFYEGDNLTEEEFYEALAEFHKQIEEGIKKLVAEEQKREI